MTEARQGHQLSRFLPHKWSLRAREMPTFLESFSKTLRGETGWDHRGDAHISETVVSCTRNAYFNLKWPCAKQHTQKLHHVQKLQQVSCEIVGKDG